LTVGGRSTKIGAGDREARMRLRGRRESGAETAAVRKKRLDRDALVRTWVPWGIVIAAIASPLTAVLGAVSEEHGADAQNVARQTLLNQQQLQLEDADAVDGDMHAFTQLEQASLMARADRRAARAASGARRHRLRGRAVEQIRVARAVSGFEYQAFLRPAVNEDGTLRYHKTWFRRARSVAPQQDARLEDLPSLKRLQERARAERERGDTLVALAASFIFALLLFTAAANFASGGAKVRRLAYGGTVLMLVTAVATVVVLIPWDLD
jgi:hypothetical protein